jgi:aminoglycoside phosphotransferase (APT) family kinase protein
MYKNGKLFFIDLGTSGYGHPIFDIASMFMWYNIVAADPERRKKDKLLNFLMMKK